MAKVKKKEEVSLEEKLEYALVPVDEQPYEVPENWCFFRFTSLIDIEGGTQPPKSQFIEEPMDGYVRLVQIRDFASDKYVVYVPDTKRLRKFNKEDIMIARYGASIGRICTGLEGAYNVALAKTIFSEQILNRSYVYWMLQSETFQNPLTTISRSAQAGFNKEDLSNFAMPLPPYKEQQRIVEQIEKLFAMLDEAKEKAQDALESFDKRKAAILNKAIRGELTIEWRKNNQIDLTSWDNVKFKDFCLLKRGYDLPTNERVSGDFPLVTSSGVNDYICEYKVKGPGVITGRSGTIGKVFLVEDDYWPLNTTLYSENLYENEPEYVYYFLQTFDFKKYSSSTAVPTLNRNLFSDVIVSVPTKEEQIQIVKVIKRLLDSEEHIKELIVNTINDIDIMKKTVLAKAFRGELCTNSPNDESAIELLKSILTIG